MRFNFNVNANDKFPPPDSPPRQILFPIHRDKFRHYFEQACRKAKIKDFRFHDLRHSAASAMARAGVPERQMQEVLGHKSVAMTKRYTHLRPSELDEAVAAMGTSIKNQGEE